MSLSLLEMLVIALVVASLLVFALLWLRRLFMQPVTQRLQALEAKLDEVLRAIESSRGTN